MKNTQEADINILLKKCKTSEDVMKVMNTYLNNKNIHNKYSMALQINLKKQTELSKSLQIAYNFLLNQEFPTKSHDTAYVRFKGTAIGGMECHSRY